MNLPASASSAAGNRKRQRLSQQNGAELGDQSPPAGRLYKHALESIFAFLTIKELSQANAVSRAWEAAVNSMRSIRAATVLVHRPFALMEASASRLARHIGTLGSVEIPVLMDQEKLYFAGLRFSALKILICQLQLPVAPSLRFPPSVTGLCVQVLEPQSALNYREQVDLVIHAVSRIPELYGLCLALDQVTELVSFAPLRQATHLESLHLFGCEVLNRMQVDQLRDIPNLIDLRMPSDGPALRLLLRAPHQLKWEKLRVKWPLDDELIGLLASVPSLTHLEILGSGVSLPEQSLLSQQIVPRVGQFENLTSVSISDSLTEAQINSAQITAVLSHMPAVSELVLSHLSCLESLSFLSSKSLQGSLTSLTFIDCSRRVSAFELVHVVVLKQLIHLCIRDSFSEPVDSFIKQQLQLRLPGLQLVMS